MPIDTSPLKIALLQLYSNGDCLFATIVANQIKTDYPNSELTWYIASNCKSVIYNNPTIDHIVTVDLKDKIADEVWYRIHQKIKNDNEFDLFFSTQIIGDNEANYNGTIRGTILENYPNPITVSKKPIVILTSEEIENVKSFSINNHLLDYRNVVLFECAPVSGQIGLNPKIATEMSEIVLKDLTDTCIILTSGVKIQSNNSNILDASVLSIRENAELINQCTHFIGCSSGISWLNTSSWCNSIPILQLLDNTSFYFNSMCNDYAYNKLDSSLITEIKFDDLEAINKIMVEFIKDYQTAKEKYHVKLNDKSSTIYTLCRRFISAHKVGSAFRIIRKTFFLNKFNWHYYYKIAKLILFSPVFYLKYYFKK